MSLDAMDWVWTNSHSKGVARLVMLAIADKATGPDCKAYAGLTFLQERANAGRSTVVGVLRELGMSGELEIVDGETGRYGAAVYRLPKALGHLRGDSNASRRSVQDLHRLDRGNASEIGADPAPEQGSTPGDNGADSAPIGTAANIQSGAGSAPISTLGADSISAGSAPIGEAVQLQIGADSGQESVQILDGIGADPAPHHQEPKKNQRTRSSAAASRPKGDPKPKQARTRTAAPDAFEVTDELAEWAWNEHKVPRRVAVSQTELFLNHHRARGNTMASWTAAWKNWIAKVPEWSPHLLRTANANQSGASYRNDPDANYGQGFPGTVTTYGKD